MDVHVLLPQGWNLSQIPSSPMAVASLGVQQSCQIMASAEYHQRFITVHYLHSSGTSEPQSQTGHSVLGAVQTQYVQPQIITAQEKSKIIHWLCFHSEKFSPENDRFPLSPYSKDYCGSS